MLTQEERAVIVRAVEKCKRFYRALQPDAHSHECWAEIEALEDLLHE